MPGRARRLVDNVWITRAYERKYSKEPGIFSDAKAEGVKLDERAGVGLLVSALVFFEG